MTTNSAAVPTDHPAMAGHFPGHPVVPGVVIMENILQQLGELHPGLVCSGVKKLKFLAPLAPGEVFEISFAEPSETSIRFTAMIGETKLATGRLALQAN